MRFINSNVIKFGSMIDIYRDRVIPRIVNNNHYGLNTSFKIIHYLKIRNRKSKYIFI